MQIKYRKQLIGLYILLYQIPFCTVTPKKHQAFFEIEIQAKPKSYKKDIKYIDGFYDLSQNILALT